MAYISVSDLLDRYGTEEILQRTDKTELVSEELMEAAVAGEDLSGYPPEEQAAVADAIRLAEIAANDATDLINGYIAGRYQLPLMPVPGVLIRLCSEVARYNLYDDAPTEAIQDRKTATLKTLRDIADGRLSLGADKLGAAPQTAQSAVMVSDGRVFGRESTGGFI
ncbi:MAG TPA: phage protein Gp36 family protein [Pseudomonas sp.]|uniref:gp436 family protein n=1 Tax=Pseudomonas sp. TaxID=306 RepID=UPI002BA9A29F|nr:phage protein Gp36 family protein [Pseudomonas sp.]HWH86352.1 phage protein Gp36 family protein [Pseudomonas sp.]